LIIIGNSEKSKEEFDTLINYSPYHNIPSPFSIFWDNPTMSLLEKILRVIGAILTFDPSLCQLPYPSTLLLTGLNY